MLALTPRELRRVTAVLASLWLLGGCASTRVLSEWVDPQYQGGPLKKVVIFVAAKDEAVRRVAEDRAVSSLPAGTQGLASYTLFPDQSDLGEAPQSKVKTALVAAGVDGAIVARLESVDKDTVYVPPQTYISPGFASPVWAPPYGSFYGYSGYAYRYGYTSPGYAYESKRYHIETVVYKIPEGNIIWTATTESIDPDSRQQLMDELVGIVGEALRRDGILAP